MSQIEYQRMKAFLTRGYWFVVTAALLIAASCTSLYKTVSITEETVDKAMTAWADHALWASKQPGADKEALARQRERVATAYGAYRAAANAFYDARKAYVKGTTAEMDLDAAQTAWEAAGESVVKLVNAILEVSKT